MENPTHNFNQDTIEIYVKVMLILLFIKTKENIVNIWTLDLAR